MLSLLIWSLAAHATPFDCDEALTRFALRAQPPAARERVAMNQALGLTPTTAVAFVPPNVIDPVAAADAFAEPEFSLELGMTVPFAARFLAYPVTHVNFTLDEWTGIPDDARIFAMHLRSGEVDRHLGGTLNRGDDARVPEALAFLRYHRRGDDFIVTKIRGEGFANANASARNRFGGWEEALLYAFERFADASSVDHGWRVVIAGPEYHARRAPDQDPAQARRLYLALPQRLGYHELNARLAPEVNGSVSMAPIEIGRAFAIALRDQTGARQGRADAYANLTLTRTNRLEVARTALAKRMPRLGTAAPVPAPEGFVAEVKFTPYPPAQLYQYKAQRTLHERLLKNVVPPWATAFGKTTLISLARASRDEVVTQPMQWQRAAVDFGHEPAHERVASVRSAGYPGVVTVKGVGRRTLAGDDDLAPQVFAPRPSALPGHRLWGGVLDTAGVFEFHQHLHLWALGERAGVAPSIAVPLGIGWPDQMPRVNGRDRQLVHTDEYLENELRDAPERPVQARYFAKAHHRAAPVPTLLDAGDVAHAADPLLRETYAAFNEDLKLPDETPPVGEPDHARAGRYLARVASLNGLAPGRILRRWAERTITTIGLVHGAGGHLGGSRKIMARESRELGDAVEFGAPGGGATAKRNVTVAGELRDLDENVFLPTNPGRPWGYPRAPSPEQRDQLQRQDLRHWAEAYYWMSVLLRGLDDVPDGARLPSDVLDDAGDLNLAAVPTTGDEREAFAFRELHRALIVDTEGGGPIRFMNKDLGDAYAYARERAANAPAAP